MAMGIARGRRREAARRGSHGFSLIEIIVAMALMSILAGAAAAVSLRSLRGNLRERTLLRLQAIMTAMIGDPDRADRGYLGDMGELPDTALTQLFVRGTQPIAVADPNDAILSGYNGPYIVEGADATRGFVDFWNSTIRYTPGTAQLTSLGPDRTLGTADDIVYPSVVPVTSGTITVIVKGLLSAGGPPVSLRSDEATVTVSYTRASDNTRTTATVTYPGAQGTGLWKTSSALHLGYHCVYVVGLASASGHDFTGSYAREVVSLTRGPAYVTVMLQEAP